MTALLSIVALSGLCTLSSCHPRRYVFVRDQKSWTEAQSHCREKHTDLATVENMEDVHRLAGSADRGYNEKVWIGLYDDITSWRWSLENESYYGAGEARFRKWASGSPDNRGGNEHCAVMSNTGEWWDYNCFERLSFICYTKISPTFVLVEQKKNWTEAQSHCREHHADLASVRNPAENQELQTMIKGTPAWIGLFRGSWKWTDRANSSFRYWKTTEPDNRHGNEACAAADFSSSGRWADSPCDVRRTSVCSDSGKKQVMRVKLTLNSPVDLNDPAVMEAMLQQLSQRLKDKGVTEDVKLSWRERRDGKFFHVDEGMKREKKSRERKPVMTKREL